MRVEPRFNLRIGRVIAGKYEVVGFLGAGREGEVYRVVERRTGAVRAVKLFYPERNPGDRALRYYASKLERLKGCSLVIQYHHSEAMRVGGEHVSVFVSEFVEGELLKDLMRRSPGGRLPPYEALVILRDLAAGVAEIHARKEYHGDLYEGNVLVRRRGVRFDLRAVDIQDFGRPTRQNISDDVCDLVRILYEMVGGRRRYASQPPEVRSVCLGLKRSLIARRFPTATELCRHLDSFEWSDAAPQVVVRPAAGPRGRPANGRAE